MQKMKSIIVVFAISTAQLVDIIGVVGSIPGSNISGSEGVRPVLNGKNGTDSATNSKTWRDVSLSPDDRAAALLALLTWEEKAKYLSNYLKPLDDKRDWTGGTAGVEY